MATQPQALLLSAAGLSFVFGAMEFADPTRQTARPAHLRGNIGIDFPEVMV
jgi:hypothetical protein